MVYNVLMKSRKLLFYYKCAIFVLFLFHSFTISSQSYNAILVHQQTDIVVKNQKIHITRGFDIQINNRNGEDATEISIPYSKLVKVSGIEACIKDILGRVVKKLKPSDITERSSFADYSLYEDNFVKEFSLVHNVYPYILHYSYQEEQKNFLYIENWIPVISREIPTLSATLNLLAPTQFNIKSYTENIDSFKSDTIESSIQYAWKASYKKPIDWEIFSPALHTFFPTVILVPEKFTYDIEGSFANWKSFGNWQSRLIEGLSELPAAEKTKIATLTNGFVDKKEKVKILYHYLQDETRYVNVSITTGGMKPYPASYVAENKYGDCKALSNYFRSMLSCIGINSYYVIVRAGDEIKKVKMDFPSLQFNHAIVCVPLDNDTLWLDCTSDGPFNRLGTFTQNREVFLVDKTNSYFTKTPALSKHEVLETRFIRLMLSSEKEILADFHNIYRGKNFESLSDLMKGGSESNQAQVIRLNYIDSGFDLVDHKIVNAPRDSAFITLNYTAKNNKLYKEYPEEQLVKLVPFEIPLFQKPALRKLPVQLDFPIYKIDTLEYQIPEGYKLSSLSPDQSIKTVFGEYNLQTKFLENKVVVVKNFLLNSGNYPIEQYSKFYEFVNQVKGFENNMYIITKKINQ